MFFRRERNWNILIYLKYSQNGKIFLWQRFENVSSKLLNIKFQVFQFISEWISHLNQTIFNW
jgi:hypothetical protein